jgi:hypothetical protein
MIYDEIEVAVNLHMWHPHIIREDIDRVGHPQQLQP